MVTESGDLIILAVSRAEVTLDAIFEATIQVLLRDGPRSLTTTRVAERAFPRG